MDISAQLTEWFELLRLQGFGHVTLYKYSMHENNLKVLRYRAVIIITRTLLQVICYIRYYQMIGFASLLTFAMPPGRPFKNGELEELYMAQVPDMGRALDAVANQDCFYR